MNINIVEKVMKYRCLLCFYDKCLFENFSVIKNLINNNALEIVGVTSFYDTNIKLYKMYLGFPVFSIDDIKFLSIDLIIIFSYDGNYLNLWESRFIDLGYSNDQILRWNIVNRFGFDISKYQKLKRDVPTIFSPNCWGGITYNSLGLEFHSPLINLWTSQEDFLKFCKNYEQYITEQLTLISYKYEQNLKHNYPVCKCGDITLNFNHYLTFDEAVEAWDRRKSRINSNNIFVMFFCENESLLEDFCLLKYRKVCFINFKRDSQILNDNIYYINHKNNSELSKQTFPDIILNMARGDLLFYNIFDLLTSNNICSTSLFNNSKLC